MTNKLLNVKEVAELLETSTDVVYQMVRRKQIPYFKVGCRLIRFQLASIQKWMNGQEDNNFPTHS